LLLGTRAGVRVARVAAGVRAVRVRAVRVRAIRVRVAGVGVARVAAGVARVGRLGGSRRDLLGGRSEVVSRLPGIAWLRGLGRRRRFGIDCLGLGARILGLVGLRDLLRGLGFL